MVFDSTNDELWPNTLIYLCSELDTDQLQCECYWYDTILAYLSKSNEVIEGRIQCSAPATLNGFRDFTNASDIRARKTDFICSMFLTLLSTTQSMIRIFEKVNLRQPVF